MTGPDSILALIADLFWPTDPTTQAAILLLLGLASAAAGAIHLPLIVRLIRIGQLQRSVQACFDEEDSNAIQRQEVANAFAESPLAYHWSDFVRRWHNAVATDPIQDASLPELSRAPVRLADVLDEHPLIPPGARRSLLPSLPAIFLSAGLLGAFAGLVLALPGIGHSLAPPSFDPPARSHQLASLMDHLGMALRIGLWGLLLSLAAAISGRLIEGRSDVLGETLDSWVQLAYGAISSGELATRQAHEQRMSLARLQEEVGELSRQVAGRPRPLIRSTAAVPGTTPGAAPTANPDGQAALRAVEALGEALSRKIDHTITEQVASLRESLGQAIATLGSQPSGVDSSVPAELGDAVGRLVKGAESQNDASRSLTETARTVSDAAEELRAGLDDFADAGTRMRATGTALTLTSQQVENAQQVVNRASETLATSLERSETLAGEHHEHLDARFGDLRAVLAGLAEQIEQLRQTEARTPEPLEIDEPVPEPSPEPPRQEEPIPTPTAPAPVPPASTDLGSEADTIPYMKAPTLARITPRDADSATPAGDSSPPEADDGRGLSGLLRATHHSGPSSDLPDPDFDSAPTVMLEPSSSSTPRAAAEPGESDEEPEAGPEDEDGKPPPRRGIFNRRK